MVVALLVVNCGVVWYHGDPRDRLQEGDVAGASPAKEKQRSVLGAKPDPMLVGPAYDATLGLRTPGLVQRVEVIKLKAGQSVAQALVAAGVAPAAVSGSIAALAAEIDFRRFRPGDVCRARYDAESNLVSIDVERGALEHARAERVGSGWRAKKLTIPVDTVVAPVTGEVRSSLWGALVEEGGELPALVTQLVDVFAWDIDFYSDVQAGDTFRLLVEKRFVHGKHLDYGPVLAAEYVVGGRPVRAFLHRAESGATSYYDADGNSVQKQLLKAPLQYGHVTSGFGMRNHPVLGYSRAHNGVDYGVPTGTPVWSVGEGRVLRAGWHGGFGNYVEIRHPNGWSSEYAHLQRVHVKVGQSVAQKHVIGTVGSTGLSTGPHLHYGLRRHGGYVNPAAQKFERGKALDGVERRRFLEMVAERARQLDGVNVARRGAAEASQG